MNGAEYRDTDGNPRDTARYRWWERDVGTLRKAAEIPGDAKSADGVTPFPPLPNTAVTGALPGFPPASRCCMATTGARQTEHRPQRQVGVPRLERRQGGPLVAYRSSGETECCLTTSWILVGGRDLAAHCGYCCVRSVAMLGGAPIGKIWRVPERNLDRGFELGERVRPSVLRIAHRKPWRQIFTAGPGRTPTGIPFHRFAAGHVTEAVRASVP